MKTFSVGLKMALFFLMSAFFGELFASEKCRELFSQKTVQALSPQDLRRHITQGALLSRSQGLEFQYYLGTAFGELATNKGLKDVLDIMEKYPGQLNKIPIREQEITLFIKTKNTPESLNHFLKSFRSYANRVRRSFQISANWGDWAKMLSFKPDHLTKKERKEQFFKYLESGPLGQLALEFVENYNLPFNISPLQTVKEFIETPSNHYRRKTFILYTVLNELRQKAIGEGREDINEKLSITMAELIHVTGFGNPYWTEQLKSQNPLEVMEAIEPILSERDLMATSLGFNDYQELKNFLLDPLHSSKAKSVKKELENIEVQVKELAQDLAPQLEEVPHAESFKMRLLTLQESPFRGCLGKDCSTDSYFEKALDPAYLYFTLTDSELRSHGHITVVLGTAKNKEDHTVKTAFVDKIQNIPNNRLIPMLEAIKQSLNEQAYKLALPEDIDIWDMNDLSNEDSTIIFVQNKILPGLKNQLNSFKPEKTTLPFENGYSKAGLFLNLREFNLNQLIKASEIDMLSLQLSNGFKIQPGKIHLPKKLDESFKIKDWLLRIIKSNNEEDHLLLITLLPELKKSHLLEENEAFNYLQSKIENKSLSFELRKQALFTLIKLHVYTIEEQKKILKSNEWNPNLIKQLNFYFLVSWFSKFSKKEQTSLIGEMSNWKKARALGKKKFITMLSYSLFDRNLFEMALKSNLSTLLDKNILYGDGDHTALTYAITNKWGLDTVKTLIEHGIPLELKNSEGWTPLIEAIRAENTELIKFLLKKGADPNGKDNDGWTPWLWAAYMEDLVTLKILSKKGVDIYAKNKNSLSAIDLSRPGISDQNKNNGSREFIIQKTREKPKIENGRGDRI